MKRTSFSILSSRNVRNTDRPLVPPCISSTRLQTDTVSLMIVSLSTIRNVRTGRVAKGVESGEGLWAPKMGRVMPLLQFFSTHCLWPQRPLLHNTNQKKYRWSTSLPREDCLRWNTLFPFCLISAEIHWFTFCYDSHLAFEKSTQRLTDFGLLTTMY